MDAKVKVTQLIELANEKGHRTPRQILKDDVAGCKDENNLKDKVCLERI